MSQQYLVIHAFPEGMVAVIRHVVNGLLFAELSGRIPLILWQDRFLYFESQENKTKNHFPNFYAAKDFCDLSGLKANAKTFAPNGWNQSNIDRDDLIEYRHDETRTDFQPLTPEQILSSSADVIVYTHYQHLLDIIPLIPKSSKYHELPNSLVARKIYQKNLVLTSDLQNTIRRYCEEFTSGEDIIGIHCRGSDKISEHALATPAAYMRALAQRFTKVHSLFLATDAERAFHFFQQKFSGRIVAINCQRSSSSLGIHFSAKNREQAGKEFLVDAYLLSYCKWHLGNHGSHMSYLVQSMIRTEGDPYDNFLHVNAPLSAKVERFVKSQIPTAARRLKAKLLSCLGRK
jgi:protein O-GlcNAc transferase